MAFQGNWLARRRSARWIAVLADVFQIVVFPAFFPGIVSPLNDILDVAVAIVMVALVGWHIAFLPTFLAELVPGIGLFPTWTIAVLFVTRKEPN